MFKTFLLALILITFGHVSIAEDFLNDPKELCPYFSSLGMKVQYQWGPAPQGEAYMCQYADEFGSNTRYVRSARVYVDPESKTVSVGLSIQGFALVRAEAVDTFRDYANNLYLAYDQKFPTNIFEAMVTNEINAIDEGLYTVNISDIKLWKSQRVVGASWTSNATNKQLASLKQSITQEELAIRSAVKAKLEQRCQVAVEASGVSGNIPALKMTTTLLSASQYLVSFKTDNSSFSCQICDDTDPNINCGFMGLRLSYTEQEKSPVSLPAELNLKCEYHLQDKLSSQTNSFIDHEILKRIETREVPNDGRYVYIHKYEGKIFRCVIRKKDMSFRLESQIDDGKWQSMIGGTML